MKKIFVIVLLISGLSLLAVNIYGLFQDVRPKTLSTEPLRFPNDVSLNFDQAMQHIELQEQEAQIDYVIRMTNVISQSLAHIHWNEEQDITKYNQLIPIWENYFLYFMGITSGIPEYEKYHFAHYQRSLRRGVGICGDASMVMSQLLDKQGIANQILSFPGHVVVAATVNGKEGVYDPDFGVVLPLTPDEIKQAPTTIYQHYVDKGYSFKEIQNLMRAYNLGFKRWDGVSHFITNKYYFEKVAYALKWPLPVFLILFATYLWLRDSRTVQQKK